MAMKKRRHASELTERNTSRIFGTFDIVFSLFYAERLCGDTCRSAILIAQKSVPLIIPLRYYLGILNVMEAHYDPRPFDISIHNYSRCDQPGGHRFWPGRNIWHD